MRKMNDNKPKTEQKQYTQFTMREDKETLDSYHELAKKAGKKTLANLVRELLAAFERNPEILNYPITQQTLTPPDPSEKILSILSSIEERQNQRKLDEERDSQLLIESRRLLEGMAVKGLKMKRHDSHAMLEGIDQSGEAIFDE